MVRAGVAGGSAEMTLSSWDRDHINAQGKKGSKGIFSFEVRYRSASYATYEKKNQPKRLNHFNKNSDTKSLYKTGCIEVVLSNNTNLN
jgi:hypothetical protein